MSEERTPTPAQAGTIDQMGAELVGWDGENALVKPPGAEAPIAIDPDGKTSDPHGEEPGPGGELADVADIDDYKPPATELAVRSPDRGEIARAMDRNDEVLILEEIQGRAIETWVYSFSQSGSLVTDLSVHGVNETVRLMNERGGAQIGISEQAPLVDEVTEADGETYYRVMVFARDARNPAMGRWGTAVEPKMMTLKSGEKKWDKFALTKALNKAERNALKKLIPEDWRQTVISAALNEETANRVKRLKPMAERGTPELAPPLADDRAKEIKTEIEEGWEQVREINRERLDEGRKPVMVPGLYNSLLTRAESDSHQRMEAFRDQLLGLVAKEREEETIEGEATEEPADA